MEKALRVCSIHSNKVRYNLLFREIEEGTIEFCESRGIGIIVHSPLAKGLLTGRYRPGSTFPSDDERRGSRLPGELFERHCRKQRN